jgi:hypothetical protein
MPMKDKPESVPTAADRVRFYHGAVKEAMNDTGRTSAEIDAKSRAISHRTYPMDIYVKTAAENQNTEQLFRNRKIADYANEAAKWGDVATGRKKEVVPDDPLPKYKTGGIVQKTGPAIVHKGELIIPREEVGAECCGVVSSGGWVVNPKNAGQYTGENAPWRR